MISEIKRTNKKVQRRKVFTNETMMALGARTCGTYDGRRGERNNGQQTKNVTLNNCGNFHYQLQAHAHHKKIS